MMLEHVQADQARGEAHISPGEGAQHARGATDGATEASSPQQDPSPLEGVSLVDASASLSVGQTLVTDYVLGANNTLAQIRVIDPTTHQVVAESPPDSIARMRQEMLAYQTLGSKTTNAS